jgi:hypothetical protein
VFPQHEASISGATKKRADVLIEDLRDDTRLILEHLLALSARVDALAGRG